MSIIKSRENIVQDITTYNLGFGQSTLAGRCPHCNDKVRKFYNPKFCPNCGNSIVWKQARFGNSFTVKQVVKNTRSVSYPSAVCGSDYPVSSVKSNVRKNAGLRLPLSFRFICALYEKYMHDSNIVFEDLMELEAITLIARDEGWISPANYEELQQKFLALISYARQCHVDLEHTRTFMSHLRQLYVYVYSTANVTEDAWRALSADIDNDYTTYSHGEYATLVDLIGLHIIEIENAAYRARNADDMCGVDTETKNYVSYVSLSQEVEWLILHGGWSIVSFRELVLLKLEMAYHYKCVTAEQCSELRGKLLRPLQTDSQRLENLRNLEDKVRKELKGMHLK